MIAFLGPMDEASPRILTLAPSKPLPSAEDDARRGLLEKPRSIPPKYFYDERGSRLFDRICDTREYYPTRTEQALLERSARTIIRHTLPEHLFELGSGTSRKTRVLLDACQSLEVYPIYWPLDVSREVLVTTAHDLHDTYDWLEVRVVVGDYTGGLAGLPAMPGRELALFLGGTVGNFPPAQAESFLQELASHLDEDDFLLIGLDRVKDRRVLEAAYNDTKGLTAAFNRNVLNVLNRELDADFDPEAFRHVALYNEEAERIEMYLESKAAQTVRLGALERNIELKAGERILTELSRKFTPKSIEALLRAGGFRLLERFDAPDEWYSLALAAPR